MPEEHYFSSAPEGAARHHDVELTVLGERLTLVAASGTFSSQRLDAGTAILLRRLEPDAQSGNRLDIGCGWGPVAISLAKASPAAKVWAIDVNQRSIGLTQQNAERLGLKNLTACLPDDVPQDIQFREIWSNPPIRIGKQALHELLSLWLGRLEVNGRALLVVQKHLGADSLLTWLANTFQDFRVERVDSQKGYRVISVTRLS